MGTAMEGRVEGKRPIGRKRAVMLGDIKQKLPCDKESGAGGKTGDG